eukprot:scaffold83236_cov36-Cyclotella_meneghiniana.AAC.2
MGTIWFVNQHMILSIVSPLLVDLSGILRHRNALLSSRRILIYFFGGAIAQTNGWMKNIKLIDIQFRLKVMLSVFESPGSIVYDNPASPSIYNMNFTNSYLAFPAWLLTAAFSQVIIWPLSYSSHPWLFSSPLTCVYLPRSCALTLDVAAHQLKRVECDSKYRMS